MLRTPLIVGMFEQSSTLPFAIGVKRKLYVGGLILPKDEHVMWKRSRLRAGDELRVKIVEAEAVDKPRERFPRNASAEEERKKNATC